MRALPTFAIFVMKSLSIPAKTWQRLGLAALVALAASTAFLFGASKAEEHDSFCIACHTTPEQTYYDRAQMAMNFQGVVDLSSAHYGEPGGGFHCIDCHRGNSDLRDRAATLALGAQDALIFVAGRADPAIEKSHSAAPELQNTACVRCHTDSLLEAGFNNHFHNKLMAAYEAQEENRNSPKDEFSSTVTCTDCHRAHVQMDEAQEQSFLDVEGAVYPACVKCHREMRKGPQELER